MNVNSDFFYIAHDLLGAGWRRRYLICSCILFVPIISALLSFFIPKKYVVSGTVMVYDTSLLNPFLKDFAYSTELKKRITGLNVFIKSPEMLEKIAQTTGMITKPYTETESDEVQQYLKKNLSIKLMGDNVVAIKYQSGKPAKMVATVNTVIELFIKRLLAPKISSIGASETFLSEQIAKQEKKLDRFENELSEFKKVNVGILPSHSTIYIQNIKKLTDLLSKKEFELAGSKAKYDLMRKTVVDSNPVIGELEKTMIELNSRLSHYRSKYTENHSKVIETRQQIKQLEIQKNKILEKLKEIKTDNLQTYWNIALNSAATDEGGENIRPLLVAQLQDLQKARANIERLEKEITSLTEQISKTKKKISEISSTEKELNRIMRNINVQQDLVSKLKDRLALAGVTGDLGRLDQQSVVKILEYPKQPLKPINKPLIIFVIMGILGGVFLGIGGAFIIEMLDSSIRTVKDVEKNTGLRVITRIPRWN